MCLVSHSNLPTKWNTTLFFNVQIFYTTRHFEITINKMFQFKYNNSSEKSFSIDKVRGKNMTLLTALQRYPTYSESPTTYHTSSSIFKKNINNFILGREAGPPTLQLTPIVFTHYENFYLFFFLLSAGHTRVNIHVSHCCEHCNGGFLCEEKSFL